MCTSIGEVWMSSLIRSWIFSLGSKSSRERKSAAVFIRPGTWAMVKLNCRTKSQAFHKSGGIILVCKNRVTDLLSVKTMTGLVDPHKIWLYSMKAKYMARNSLAYIDILI